MKKILASVASFLFTGLLGVFFALLLLEWMAGCGETYVDSKGVRHANQCIFLSK